ncbi:Cell polarity protein alp11 [Ceratocystis fimbriata CBS 114723]|uniref:Cell polarity protein alp11 n=1 Tax=Ceratocystis fimbriata CBS 114723 TaxID=1035309 RepID=A0A2C5XJG6_9PEZI|nr:Cell polarity protein alp11 [Ceratocystis fimbriata CBS 114723]
MTDVSLFVVSDYSASERRITPSWSIDQLRAKMETVTGIPPSCQQISYKTPSGEVIPVSAADEEKTTLEGWNLSRQGELRINDTRPASARPNFTDMSNVEKYVMPDDEYDKKDDSVRAWKRTHKLGRFDPDAPRAEAERLSSMANEIEERGIKVGLRCRVGGDDDRRGCVQYVGEVPEISGGTGPWIGVQLDEPVGKNDGSINGKRYWGAESAMKHGVFVRSERVEMGDFPVLNDLEEMEEI